MKNERKTKERLISEVLELRQRVAELEEAAQRSRWIEKAIEKAKRQWERTFDSVPDLMAIIDKDYQIVRLNKSMAHRCGLEPRDAVGRKCYELIHGTHEPPPACPHEFMWETEREYEVEVFSPALGGTFLVSVSPFHDSEGNVVGSVHAARDISALKKAEAALRESEARYRALAEHMGNGVAIYRAENEGEDFVLVEFNRAAEKIEHLSRNEIIGKSAVRIFPGIKRFGLFDVFQRVWQTGEAEMLKTSKYSDGRIEGWRQSFVYKLPSGEIVAVYSDETDRVEAEEALKESEARYRQLVDVSPIAIAVVVDGQYVFVNQEAVKMEGAEDAKDILGLRPEEVIEPAYGSVAEELVWQPLSEGRSVPPVELRMRRRSDGTVRDVEVAATPVTHQGQRAAQLVIRDITDRKRAQQKLVESEERFRAIFDSARECIFIKDRDRRYTHVNPYMASLLELPSSAIVNRTDEEIYGPKAGHHLKSVDLRVLEGETVEEEHTRSIKGNTVTFLDVRVPMRDANGEVVGVCGIARNITGRKPVHNLENPADEEYVSEAMRSVLQAAAMAAQTDSVVLLTGESGSGKDYLARVIHDNSKRAEGPFFSINCAAVAPELAESELFGHEPGAYTGARGRQRGLLELAEGGTLLLNEIGELPLALQAKLLTFLDSRCFTRVGGRQNIRVDARLIAATNREVKKEVSDGNFRADLFYRLNVLSIKMPPLRERVKDIPVLVKRIVNELSRELQLPDVPEIDAQAMRRLTGYEWPGNVRELRNVLERGLILSGGASLSVDSLGIDFKESSDTSWTVAFPPRGSLTETVSDLKSRFIEEALSRSGGNKQQAAMILGISRFALGRHLKKLGLE